jgi:uncharacterized protein
MKRYPFYIFTLLTYLMIMPVQAAEDAITPQLTVKGNATISKPADQMELTVAVVTQNPDSKKAVRDNNEKMNQVLANLENIKLEKHEYQTDHFRIQPVYHYPNPNDPKYSEGPSITHYEVANTIRIKTQKLDQAEKILGAVIQAGANQIEQLQFNLKDPRIYRNEVIQLATRNALADAAALSEAAQVRLVRVLSLELNQEPQPFPVPRMMAYSADAETAAYEAPVQIGQVQIQASVHVTFEIATVNQK